MGWFGNPSPIFELIISSLDCWTFAVENGNFGNWGFFFYGNYIAGISALLVGKIWMHYPSKDWFLRLVFFCTFHHLLSNRFRYLMLQVGNGSNLIPWSALEEWCRICLERSSILALSRYFFFLQLGFLHRFVLFFFFLLVWSFNGSILYFFQRMDRTGGQINTLMELCSRCLLDANLHMNQISGSVFSCIVFLWVPFYWMHYICDCVLLFYLVVATWKWLGCRDSWNSILGSWP